MLNVRKILFPTDFSRCSLQALEHALMLSKYYKSELHLTSVYTLYDNQSTLINTIPDFKDFYTAVLDYYADKLKSIVDQQDGQGVKLIAKQLRGVSAAETILEYETDNDIDLIVMGTNGRRGIQHVFLGSIAEEVVRFSKCPVLTIREQEKKVDLGAVERILIPIDFSEHSKIALTYGEEIQNIYSTKIDVLHIFEDMNHPVYYHSSEKEIEEFKNKLIKNSRSSIQRFLNEAKFEQNETEVHFREGHVAREITKFIEENNIDLVIIPSHGQSGLEHFLLGSISEKVVRRSMCPVLTVKSFGKSLLKE